METLELARETCIELISSPARRGPYLANLSLSGESAEASLEEPPKGELRAFLVLLRTLDMKTSDIRLERLFPILERMLPDDPWPLRLAGARQQYEDLQRPPPAPQHPDLEAPLVDGKPPLFTPSQAWRLWLDAIAIHRDYQKELRWGRLDPIGQWALRTLAHDYGSMLFRETILVDAAIEALGIGPVLDEDYPPEAKPMAFLDGIIDLAEAAERLGLRPVTLRAQVANRRFLARKVGNTWITTDEEVERYRAETLGRLGRPAIVQPVITEAEPKRRGRPRKPLPAEVARIESMIKGTDRAKKP